MASRRKRDYKDSKKYKTKITIRHKRKEKEPSGKNYRFKKRLLIEKESSFDENTLDK